VDHRAGAELDLAAELLGVQSGVVAGEVDVDDDHHVRVPAQRHRLGAHERRLLVDGGERRQARGCGGGGVVFHGPRAHVDAGAVVEGRRGEAAVGERQEVGREGDGVADLDQREGLVAGARADVDPLVVQVGRLGALLGRHLVRGLAADHAVHRAAGAVDHKVAAGEQLRVHAADLVERDEAVLVHVGDDEADLVVVRRHHDVWRTLRDHVGPEVAERVALRGGDRGQAPADDLLGRRFEAGGRGCGAEVAQEFEVGGHGSLRRSSCACGRARTAGDPSILPGRRPKGTRTPGGARYPRGAAP